MIRLDEREAHALAQVAEHMPAVREWVERWAKTEMERLPVAVANVAVAQGRCQVLQELLKALDEAPETAAQLRRQAK